FVRSCVYLCIFVLMYRRARDLSHDYTYFLGQNCCVVPSSIALKRSILDLHVLVSNIAAATSSMYHMLHCNSLPKVDFSSLSRSLEVGNINELRKTACVTYSWHQLEHFARVSAHSKHTLRRNRRFSAFPHPISLQKNPR